MWTENKFNTWGPGPGRRIPDTSSVLKSQCLAPFLSFYKVNAPFKHRKKPALRHGFKDWNLVANTPDALLISTLFPHHPRHTWHGWREMMTEDSVCIWLTQAERLLKRLSSVPFRTSYPTEGLESQCHSCKLSACLPLSHVQVSFAEHHRGVAVAR